MWYYSLFSTLYNWFIAFASGMSELWQWLIAPINFLGVSVAPIYALVGSVAIIGIVRRLF